MNQHHPAHAIIDPPVPDENQRAAIRREVKRIEESPAFSNSSRAKEFLWYVVEHALEGRTELLKERSIGVSLFHRGPTYATGEDPIVRVNAAEVRKRLVQYYAEVKQLPEVRIELPIGSYHPRFHWNHSARHGVPSSETLVVEPPPPRQKFRVWKAVIIMAGVAILGLLMATAVRRFIPKKSASDEFWAPVLVTGKPILICIASPVIYGLSDKIFLEASREHPGLYDSELQRTVNPLELDPKTLLRWHDVTVYPDTVVNKAHVYNVAGLAALFTQMHKSSEVKIGSDLSYNDLQNSPAILMGAFDNPWSVRLGSELPFFLREQDDKIVERGGQGRIWLSGELDKGKDFAIIARLVNSKTGQFLIILAGISEPGTEAAGKIVSNPALLNAALRSAPPGWQDKNLEIVIETDRIGSADSSTRVVAMKSW